MTTSGFDNGAVGCGLGGGGVGVIVAVSIRVGSVVTGSAWPVGSNVSATDPTLPFSS